MIEKTERRGFMKKSSQYLAAAMIGIIMKPIGL